MTTGSSNDLIKEGIQRVQANQAAEAYPLFKEATSRDPNNEFAWIWLSVTSNNRTEKRAALDRALQINPNSQHASDALRALEAEEGNLPAASTAAYGATPPPPNFTTSPRIGESEQSTAPRYTQSDPLRAALSDEPDGKKAKAPKVTKVKINNKDQRMISQPPRGQATARRIRIILLVFLVLILIGLAAYFVLQQLQKNQDANQANNPPPTADTTTAAATSINVTTTVAAGTTSAVATTAAVVTTAAPATTAVATTVAGTTTAASTTTTATTAATGTTLPAGSADTAQVAKALQAARDSLASGDYKAAISSYQTALQSDPRNVAANLGLGNAYLTAPVSAIPSGVDRFVEAVRAFRLVTGQAPNWPGGHTRLGEALAAQGDLKGAIAAFSKGLELDPNGPERWLALASLYDRDNQPEAARFARERAGNLSAAPTATPVPTPQPTNRPAPPAPTPTPKK